MYNINFSNLFLLYPSSFSTLKTHLEGIHKFQGHLLDNYTKNNP